MRYRQLLHQSAQLAIFGDERQAERDPRLDVQPVQIFAVEHNRAARFGVQPDQAFQQFGAACAHQAVNADDFARVQRERHMIDHIAAADARQGQVFDAQHFLLQRVIAVGEQAVRPPPDHLLDDPVEADIGGGRFRDQHPIAQHGEGITDVQQFVQLVRDVNNRHILRFQFADNAEQHFDFGIAQRRSRLVHDQDADVLRQRFGDLDDLLLADAQIADRGFGIDVLFQAASSGRG